MAIIKITPEIRKVQALQADWLNAHVSRIWDSYTEIWPKLARFDAPKISINNRFTRCAGMCYQEENRIELGGKFILDKRYKANMLAVILPHELAHQIDFNLFGESELKCGHGEKWREVMLKLGLAPNKHHSMEL